MLPAAGAGEVIGEQGERAGDMAQAVEPVEAVQSMEVAGARAEHAGEDEGSCAEVRRSVFFRARLPSKKEKETWSDFLN